jgi:hypothetical protein
VCICSPDLARATRRSGCWSLPPADEGNLRFSGLHLLEGVPVTVCAVATVAWEGSPGVAVFG